MWRGTLLIGLILLAAACSAANSAPSGSERLQAAERASKVSPGSEGQTTDMASIRAAQQRIILDRQSLSTGDLQAPALRGARADSGCIGVQIIEQPPQIRVSLPVVTNEAKDWFESRYNVPLDFSSGVAVLEGVSDETKDACA